jgi:hypothetical protein
MFLHASRQMLHIYEHLDVECPDSTSLVIRMFQAGALHTDGKLRLSWHLFSAALRLGEQMQLQDPRHLQGLRVMAFRTIRIPQDTTECSRTIPWVYAILHGQHFHIQMPNQRSH